MANQISIQVGADIKDLQEGIKTAVSTLEKGGKDMTAVSASVARLTTNNFKDVGQAYRATSKDALILASNLGTESEAFKQAASMAQIYGNELNDIRAQIAGANMSSDNVQKATGQFNMLGNSINQITREMPAFTYSIQTGFMAVSNNIPMFVDQIQNIKRANLELAATGQPVQSVFSQVAGAVFSWQTALSLGITALTVFSPKIMEMIVGVKESATELKAAESAMKAYNDQIDRFIDTEETQALRRLASDFAGAKQKVQDQIAIAQIQRDITKRSGQQITEDQIQEANRLKLELKQIEEGYQRELTELVGKSVKERAQKEQSSVWLVDEGKAAQMKAQLAAFKEAFQQPFDVSTQDNLEGLKDSIVETTTATDVLAAKWENAMDKLANSEKLNAALFSIQEWSNMAAQALSGVGVALGQALMSDDFEKAGENIVRQLGAIAVQIGAAMVAIGIPQLLAGLPSGAAYVAGGTALGVVGGAMMASGKAANAPAFSGGSNNSYQPFTPNFSSGSQYLMLDSKVRGTDIIISADNQRRQNKRIR
jgi:hypothetical protein